MELFSTLEKAQEYMVKHSDQKYNYIREIELNLGILDDDNDVGTRVIFND